MRPGKLKVVALAVVVAAVPAFAGEITNVSVKNCTWCHGPSAEGYAPAPRLAGQRYQYLQDQLYGFARHKRDNPFSKMYMWFAAANLNRNSARDLAIDFSSLPPEAANDGIGTSSRQDGQSFNKVFRATT